MIEPLARRVVKLGWHIQINMPSEKIFCEHGDLERVPTQIVFDHLAHLREPEGVKDPTFAMVSGLLKAGKAWVKLSGAYADTKVGPPTYADSTEVARADVNRHRDGWSGVATGRIRRKRTTRSRMMRCCSTGCRSGRPMRASGRGFLVDNPARLYGFV